MAVHGCIGHSEKTLPTSPDPPGSPAQVPNVGILTAAAPSSRRISPGRDVLHPRLRQRPVMNLPDRKLERVRIPRPGPAVKPFIAIDTKHSAYLSSVA